MVVNLDLIHAKCLEPEVGYNRCWLFLFLMLLRFLFPGLAEQLGCVVQSILRLIYGSKGDGMAWFLTYPGREGSSQALGIPQRQRVGREETRSRSSSLVNYPLPRGALSTPLSTSISQERGA